MTNLAELRRLAAIVFLVIDDPNDSGLVVVRTGPDCGAHLLSEPGVAIGEFILGKDEEAEFWAELFSDLAESHQRQRESRKGKTEV